MCALREANCRAMRSAQRPPSRKVSRRCASSMQREVPMQAHSKPKVLQIRYRV